MVQDRDMVTIYNDALLKDVISNDLERQQDYQRDKRDAARVTINFHWLPVDSRILQYFDFCSFIALAYR